MRLRGRGGPRARVSAGPRQCRGHAPAAVNTCLVNSDITRLIFIQLLWSHMDTRYTIMKVPCQTNMKYFVTMIFLLYSLRHYFI